jgi:hypothetical protein
MRTSFAFFVMVLGSGGCFLNMFVPGFGIDMRRDASGQIVLLDTPRMWDDFVDSVERSIQREKRGEALPKERDRYWCDWIAASCTGRENPDRYVDYIRRRREEEGLQELPCPQSCDAAGGAPPDR